MTRTLAASAVLALCAVLSGCPESVHPLSDPATAAHDPALFGVWHGTFDEDEMYLHVGPADHGMTKAVAVEHKQRDGDVKVERYVAFPGTVGKLALLNVHPAGDVERDRGWFFFRYAVEKKKLTLWMLSYAAARQDIKDGKLKGIAEEGPYGDTRITATSAELARYLGQADARRLFDKPLVFRRVGT